MLLLVVLKYELLWAKGEIFKVFELIVNIGNSLIFSVVGMYTEKNGKYYLNVFLKPCFTSTLLIIIMDINT